MTGGRGDDTAAVQRSDLRYGRCCRERHRAHRQRGRPAAHRQHARGRRRRSREVMEIPSSHLHGRASADSDRRRTRRTHRHALRCKLVRLWRTVQRLESRPPVRHQFPPARRCGRRRLRSHRGPDQRRSRRHSPPRSTCSIPSLAERNQPLRRVELDVAALQTQRQSTTLSTSSVPAMCSTVARTPGFEPLSDRESDHDQTRDSVNPTPADTSWRAGAADCCRGIPVRHDRPHRSSRATGPVTVPRSD